MAFETEPLQIKSFRWIENQNGKCIALRDSSELIPVPTQDNPDLEKCIQAMMNLMGSELSLQKTILFFRKNGPAVRLSTIKAMLEFFVEHGIIENPKASEWIELLSHGTPAPLSMIDQFKSYFWPQARAPQSAAEVSPSDWSTLPILRQLEPELQSTLLKNAKRKAFVKGTYLCKKGSRNRDLMILLSGRAAVVHDGKVVATLETHSVFGETGFFLNEPRTAHVVALEAGAVLCISPPPSREAIQVDIGKFKSVQSRIWFLQALQKNPMFREIPSEALDALLTQGQIVNFKEGEDLTREGMPADSCFFIIQGHVTVTQKGETINRLATGAVIGEIGLLFGSGERTATVTALENVIAIKYSTNDFWHLLSSHFALGLTMESLAARRLIRDLKRDS